MHRGIASALLAASLGLLLTLHQHAYPTTVSARFRGALAVWGDRPRDQNSDMVAVEDNGTRALQSLDVLMYGVDLTIENQYPGKWLLQRNGNPAFTTDYARISNKAAVWQVLPVSGAADTAGCVRYGVDVIIENQYPGKKMLQRNGRPRFTRDHNRVSNKAAVWRILPKSGGLQGCVMEGTDLIVENQYAGRFMLERNSNPGFTTNHHRVDINAAVFRFWPTVVPPEDPDKDVVHGTECVLQYDQDITIENQYPGLYLLERNGIPSFTTDQDRVKIKAAVWHLRTPSRSRAPHCVSYGDRIIIQNQYQGKYILQRNTEPSFTTDYSRVSIDAAVWKILPASGSRQGCVSVSDSVVLENQYPGRWTLQRNGIPRFTTDPARRGILADVWKLKGDCKKPVKRTLTSITYPSLSDLAPVSKPESIKVKTYCNSAGEDRSFSEETFMTGEEKGVASCFALDLSFEVGQSSTITVSGNIPFLGEAEGSSTLHWTASAGTSSENCEETIVSKGRTLTLPSQTLGPHSSVKYTYSHFVGRLSELPFQANLRVEYSDGTSQETLVSGTYTGVHFSSSFGSYSDWATGVQSC